MFTCSFKHEEAKTDGSCNSDGDNASLSRAEPNVVFLEDCSFDAPFFANPTTVEFQIKAPGQQIVITCKIQDKPLTKD